MYVVFFFNFQGAKDITHLCCLAIYHKIPPILFLVKSKHSMRYMQAEFIYLSFLVRCPVIIHYRIILEIIFLLSFGAVEGTSVWWTLGVVEFFQFSPLDPGCGGPGLFGPSSSRKAECIFPMHTHSKPPKVTHTGEQCRVGHLTSDVCSHNMNDTNVLILFFASG